MEATGTNTDYTGITIEEALEELENLRHVFNYFNAYLSPEQQTEIYSQSQKAIKCISKSLNKFNEDAEAALIALVLLSALYTKECLLEIKTKGGNPPLDFSYSKLTKN